MLESAKEPKMRLQPGSKPPSSICASQSCTIYDLRHLSFDMGSGRLPKAITQDSARFWNVSNMPLRPALLDARLAAMRPIAGVEG
jgi:hypothetical protein